jgi:hypothetical protein
MKTSRKIGLDPRSAQGSLQVGGNIKMGKETGSAGFGVDDLITHCFSRLAPKGRPAK